jgi:hypothetical protein
MEARQSLLLALNAGGSSLRAKLYSLGDLTLRLETSARVEGIGRRVARFTHRRRRSVGRCHQRPRARR